VQNVEYLQFLQCNVVLRYVLPLKSSKNDFDFFEVLRISEFLSQGSKNQEEFVSGKVHDMVAAAFQIIHVVGKDVLVASEGGAEPVDEVKSVLEGHVESHDVS